MTAHVWQRTKAEAQWTTRRWAHHLTNRASRRNLSFSSSAEVGRRHSRGTGRRGALGNWSFEEVDNRRTPIIPATSAGWQPGRQCTSLPMIDGGKVLRPVLGPMCKRYSVCPISVAHRSRSYQESRFTSSSFNRSSPFRAQSRISSALALNQPSSSATASTDTASSKRPI